MIRFRRNFWWPARIVGWSLVIVIVALSIVPPNLRPGTRVPHTLEHFLIYSAAGLAFGFGYPRRYGLLTILLPMFAALIELAQLFVPGRHARLSDLVIDALAGIVGLSIAMLLAQIV